MASHYPRQRLLLPVFTLAALLVGPAAAPCQQANLDVLRIGTSGTLTGEAGSSREKAGIETLKSYIKDESGLDNELLSQKSWREVADKMAKRQLHLGVFQGYEFAWALEKHSGLKPLAIAVNVYRYPVVYILVKRGNTAADFAGLRNQSLSLPATGKGFLRLFVERQSQAAGKTLDTFFSKVTSRDNFEDALDDVVDGVVQAAVADRAALEAYKQRKPGRFKQLKSVTHSQPFPPAVVAFQDGALDEATLQRFKEGLLGAAKKEKGQTLLTLFRLTGFETIPSDFDRVLAETRKAYPPPDAKTK
jgi:ABC-type phosphate/phosphonate transport system substrate-binding protein